MSLTVTVLGSSGTYAGAGGACTGFLVRSATTTILLDAGPGTLANLQEHVELDELDGVVLSHSHPDHWLELPVMRNALKYVLGLEGMPLFTTSATLELADRLCSDGLGSAFAATAITDRSEFGIGDLSLRCSRTDHPVETLAFRIEAAGRCLAYTADTGPGWSLTELGPGIDLALSEATFVEGTPHVSPVHLSAHQAGEAARAAGVGRLVVTHVLPTVSTATALAEASEAYGAGVDLAEVHRTFEV